MKLHKMVAQELGLRWVRHLGNRVHVFRCPDSGQEKIIKIVVALQFLDEIQEPEPQEGTEPVLTDIPEAFRRAFDDDEPSLTDDGDSNDSRSGEPFSLHEALNEVLRRMRGEQ